MPERNRQSLGLQLAPGVRVDHVVAPGSAGEISDVLREATAAGTGVIPFGGRRSLATGHLAPPAPIGLDLTSLSGIITYEPADLTLSVRAGTKLAEIQAVLGERGQELPVDVPQPEQATIGGLVATGFGGPRRLRAGTLRDLLIGCEYVRGDGLAAKAGGLVVKNVSGFEIPRFLHGSWGSLAVLATVNLKVMPKPRGDGTVVAPVSGIEAGLERAGRALTGLPQLDALILTREAGVTTIAARALGRPAAVRDTLENLVDLFGQGQRLEGDESAAYWQARVDALSEREENLLVAVGARPRDIPMIASRLAALRDGALDLMVSPGTGSIRVATRQHEEMKPALRETAALATGAGAAMVVESAPEDLREIAPPWGIEPDGIALMRAIKREFDPAGILNPGRLFI